MCIKSSLWHASLVWSNCKNCLVKQKLKVDKNDGLPQVKTLRTKLFDLRQVAPTKHKFKCRLNPEIIAT